MRGAQAGLRAEHCCADCAVDNQPMSALTRGSGCTGADEEARSLPDSPSLSSSGCWSGMASLHLFHRCFTNVCV